MTKRSGLGNQLYVDGFNLSGDVGELNKIGCPMSPLVTTGIDKFGYERIGGKRDGGIDFTAFWNSSPAQEHAVLSTLPTGDRQLMFAMSTTLGDDAACLLGKQVNYDPTRGNDGSLTEAVSTLGNGWGLEWGNLLTAGIRVDSTATNGASFDLNGLGGSSLSFGWQAYLQVFGVTGTSVTCTIQDSADNTTFTALTGGAFAAATAIGAQRLAGGATATVRRYVRVATTGTFTNAQIAVMFVRNTLAVTF